MKTCTEINTLKQLNIFNEIKSAHKSLHLKMASENDNHVLKNHPKTEINGFFQQCVKYVKFSFTSEILIPNPHFVG